MSLQTPAPLPAMRRLTPFMENYGANVAGYLYNAGGVVQLLAGALLSSPRDIVAALLNFSASFTLSFFGHRNWGVAFAAVVAMMITTITAWPGIANNESSSYAGVIVAVIAQSFSAFSAPLETSYGAARSTFMREIIGQPRRTSGMGQFLFCRVPLIYGNVLHDRWVEATVFTIWAAADLAFAMSKPTVKRRQP